MHVCVCMCMCVYGVFLPEPSNPMELVNAHQSPAVLVRQMPADRRAHRRTDGMK